MIEKLIHVGGFLGSGKTTLMAEAAKRLAPANNPVAPAIAYALGFRYSLSL